jgi:hypothetical protein
MDGLIPEGMSYRMNPRKAARLPPESGGQVRALPALQGIA